MADTTKDIWNDNDGEEEQKPRKKLRGFLVFFLTLVAVLAVVVFAAYRDGTGFDALRRYLNYGSTEKAGSGSVYDYDASASNRFAVLGDRLVVLSDTRLRVLDASGGEVWSTAVNMAAPALHSGGERAVAYDVGGTALYVVDRNGEVLSLTAAEEEPFLSATLNEKGWMAVTAKKKNYKGCVNVYDDGMELVFAFNSSRRFVTDAWVAGEGNALAAVTLGQENGTFVSNVVLYDLSETEPAADYDVADGLVAAIGCVDGKLATVSDTCLTFADTKGNVEGSYDYNGAHLREYDLHGEGFAAVLLNRYQSGSVGRLVTVAADGTELGSLDVSEEVQDISACGKYLAVLYLDRLVIYNQALETYASLAGTESIRDVLVRSDGSALLLSSEYAKLFLP